MQCSRVRAAAALLVFALVALSTLPLARAADADYDLLVLRQDWQPSSCISSNCTIAAFGVFSVKALVPSGSASLDPENCTAGPEFDASQIPAKYMDQLSCILMDNAGSTEDLWKRIWDRYGTCTGMTVAEYFTFIATAFTKYDANRALAPTNIDLEADEQRVDRDRLLTNLTSVWNKKAWAACNNKTHHLTYVSTCFNRTTRELVDCPWNPNAPIEFGQECAGDVIMEQGVKPSDCEAYFNVTLRGAYPTAVESPAPSADPTPAESPAPSADPTPVESPAPSSNSSGGSGGSSSSSGSSSIGPIVGAVCGGVAIAVVAAVLFVVVRKRRAAKHAAAAAWETSTNSKDDDKLEEQPHLNSMLDTFVSMHSGDEDQPGGGTRPAARAADSLAGAGGPPTAPVTPAVVVSSLGTAAVAGSSPTPSVQAAGGEGPAALPADYRTLDSAPAPAFTGSPTAATLASGGTVGSGTSAHSGGLVSGGTAGSGGASVTPSATPSGQKLLRSGSAMWAIDFRELKLLRVCGDGSFGRVYAAEWHSTAVAVKMLHQEPSTTGSGSLSSGGGSSLNSNLAAAASLLAKLQEEADIMLSLRHPNVVQIMGVCTDPPCLVTEFCAKGSLTDCLRAARADAGAAAQLTWRRRLTMAIDAARGLLYLHSRTIVHRDLKGPNLLVDDHYRVKVSDFNLSKHLEQTRSTSLAAMNPRWLANEVMQGERATQASDVFAFAVVLHELLTWELPWAATSPWQIVGLVLGGSRLPLPLGPEAVPGPDRLPPAVFEQYTALVQSCWAHNPQYRPSLQTVVDQLRTMLAQLGGEAA